MSGNGNLKYTFIYLHLHPRKCWLNWSQEPRKGEKFMHTFKDFRRKLFPPIFKIIQLKGDLQWVEIAATNNFWKISKDGLEKTWTRINSAQQMPWGPPAASGTKFHQSHGDWSLRWGLLTIWVPQRISLLALRYNMTSKRWMVESVCLMPCGNMSKMVAWVCLSKDK